MNQFLRKYLFWCLVWIILFLIGFAIFRIIKTQKNNRQLAQLEKIYLEELRQFNAAALLKVKYLQGMIELIPNAVYLICAGETQLTIIDVANTANKFILDYSKILEFRFTCEKQITEQYGIGLLKFNPLKITTFLEHCIIKYASQDGTRDAVFQIGPLADITLYDLVAIRHCNMSDYVNARLHKSDAPVIL
jgi:hypothetical protein